MENEQIIMTLLVAMETIPLHKNGRHFFLFLRNPITNSKLKTDRKNSC